MKSKELICLMTELMSEFLSSEDSDRKISLKSILLIVSSSVFLRRLDISSSVSIVGKPNILFKTSLALFTGFFFESEVLAFEDLDFFVVFGSLIVVVSSLGDSSDI